MRKVCFVASGPIEWGSSRMRAYWVAPYMDNADVVYIGDGVPEGYDVYIWQKIVHMDTLGQLADKLHFWDVCDPLWWFSPNECQDIVRFMSGIVCSSEALREDAVGYFGHNIPIVCIPDRLEPRHFEDRVEHAPNNPLRFIWYGVAVNRISLYAAFANLQRLWANGHKFSLTIMDDRPEVPMREIEGMFPIYYTRWSLDKEVEIISSHDIALLPPYPGPWGKVKSDNKILTASACGIDFDEGDCYNDLIHTTNEADTECPGDHFWKRHHVKQSAHQWEGFVNANI